MKRPNILLITSDQQHWNTLGIDNPLIKTPALDRLAREGTRFTRAYCPNPTCSPTRASIITGQYPSEHGCWTLGTKLCEDQKTLGDHLRENGYGTALIGKAHFQPLASVEPWTSIECQPTLRDLEFWKNFRGPWYGFEEVELARNHADESHVGQHYAIWMEQKGLKNWRDYFQSWPADPTAKKRHHRWDLPEEFHYSCWTAERSIAHLDRYAAEEKPFFLWASFHDPHPPYLVPEPWDSQYDPKKMPIGQVTPGEHERNPSHFSETQKPEADFSPWKETGYAMHGFHSHLHEEGSLRQDMATYYGMIGLMDREIGKILDALDRNHLTENTIVVFTTDHGHFLGQHGLVAKGPFHYEDLLKLPFIVRYPGHVPAGTVNDALQSLIDLAPTFLTAAGLTPTAEMQGVNQLSVWQNESPSARDHVIVENRHEPTTIHLHTYITKRNKITIYAGSDDGELFDLESDPGETMNLWNEPNSQELKNSLIRKFFKTEMKKETLRMPRIAVA